jgi:hypothetical protein
MSILIIIQSFSRQWHPQLWRRCVHWHCGPNKHQVLYINFILWSLSQLCKSLFVKNLVVVHSLLIFVIAILLIQVVPTRSWRTRTYGSQLGWCSHTIGPQTVHFDGPVCLVTQRAALRCCLDPKLFHISWCWLLRARCGECSAASAQRAGDAEIRRNRIWVSSRGLGRRGTLRARVVVLWSSLHSRCCWCCLPRICYLPRIC